ncbi:uncharacterized protein SETTUDRAFT_37432 [Exserohilum turcica Et28A]|uniref:Uncharacterized protein n=1 Tax=Exserohilum turcicum (strain 28A) TaxID=671987 RepID=R0IYE0_EXST2|nr:uncharacterized protein SETTUDRAFT_37432 [Exserohilum turcica Et28A]EOA89780.1 hypothetical protein SETTUDRAFT_37432 [Exserohilum turcica Et28A]
MAPLELRLDVQLLALALALASWVELGVWLRIVGIAQAAHVTPLWLWRQGDTSTGSRAEATGRHTGCQAFFHWVAPILPFLHLPPTSRQPSNHTPRRTHAAFDGTASLTRVAHSIGPVTPDSVYTDLRALQRPDSHVPTALADDRRITTPSHYGWPLYRLLMASL